MLESELATVHEEGYLAEISALPATVEVRPAAAGAAAGDVRHCLPPPGLQTGRGYYRFSSDTFANAFTLRAAQV